MLLSAGGVGKRPSRSSIQAMIEQVRQVCPDLGEGFVEACLAVMDYSVETVVSAVVEGVELPYPLDTLDRGMIKAYRNKRDKVEETAGDAIFKARQKEFLRNLEQEQVGAQANAVMDHGTASSDLYDAVNRRTPLILWPSMMMTMTINMMSWE